MPTIQNAIGGKLVTSTSSRTQPVFNPATGEAIATLPLSTVEEINSAVAAAIVHRAVGDRLTCVFVDHGLLREGEREQVEKDYVAATGIRLVTVDAADRFLTALFAPSLPMRYCAAMSSRFPLSTSTKVAVTPCSLSTNESSRQPYRVSIFDERATSARSMRSSGDCAVQVL